MIQRIQTLYMLIVTALMAPPIRNISVPRLPKKYIGERPKCDMKSTEIRSR